MAKKEKFGKFVLLDELESTGIGSEYRAAKLSTTGLEKIVSVLRLNPALSANAEVSKHLMDQAKIAAQLQNPNIVKIFGIGKVDASYYISYEFIEGKSLKAIFNRCRQEGFPFSVDHTLLIASKICSALEYAHGRKTDAGVRYLHGLLTPACVLVSYEGEVRLRGFGYWPSQIRGAGVLTEEDSLYLAPEQSSGGAGDTKSDIFAVGAILFETLTGQPLLQGGRADVPARLAQARLQSPSTDDDSLPKPIAEILQRALAVDPAGRYGEIQEMRKAIDTLLFSGDFTPTTFNLAFFMHSLFREDIERESKALKDEKEASYLEFLTEEAAVKTAPGFKIPAPAPTASTMPAPAMAKTEVVDARQVAAAREEHAAQVSREAHAPAPPPSVHQDASPGLTAKEAAASFTFHKEEPKSRAPLMVGIAAVLLIAGAAAFFLTRGGAGGASSTATTPGAGQAQAPPSLTPEATAALAKVKELEEKLKKIEDDKAKAEAEAAEKTKKRFEEQAAKTGQAVDTAALKQAQEEAAKKAREDAAKRAEEERGKIEEQKKAEEARVAEEQRKAEDLRKTEEAARAAAAAPPTTVAPTVRPGSLVNLNEAGVTPPFAERTPALQYPPIALRQRVEGTVELNVLIDEKGGVSDVQVVTGAGGKSGLNEAAIENVKKRRYRAATKEGVPVKVWIPVRVTFVLPKS